MLNAVLALNELDTAVFDSPSPGTAPRVYDEAAPRVFDGAGQRVSDDYVTVPDAHLLFNGEFKRVGSSDLKIVGDDGQSFFIPDYFGAEKRAHLMSPQGATLSPDVVEALAGPLAPGQHAQAGAQAPGGAPVIGRVDALTGSATVVRNGVTVSLNVGDNVRRGDVVQTSGGSSVAIVLADGSTFSLSANARMILNDLVYNVSNTGNSGMISLVQGTFSFVAGQVAKNGEMRVETPVATMGIRGTAVLVEISANDGQTRFSVMVEPDGTTGSFNLYNKTTGALIATVNNSQIGWVVSPAGPLQVVAQQVQKTPGELQQELGIVQQIFTIFNNNQQNPFIPPTQEERRADNSNDANPQTAQGPGGSGQTFTVNAPVTTPDGSTPVTTPVTVTVTPLNDDATPGPLVTAIVDQLPGGGVLPNLPALNLINFSDATSGQHITGSDGPDQILGSNFGDLIDANGGNDLVFAAGGDDIIVAAHGAGNDFYDGGVDAHGDTIKFESANGVVFNLNSGTHTLPGGVTVKSSTAASASSGVDVFIRIEKIIGSPGNDIFILHDAGDWEIDAGAGTDIVRLANGVDVLDLPGGPEIENFEIVDLATDGEQNIVHFDLGDFDSIGNAAPLRILGGTNDIIQLTNTFGIGATFSKVGNDVLSNGVFADGLTDDVLFDVYEVTIGQGQYLVYVQDGVQIPLPEAQDDLASMTENEVLFVDVLANDAEGASTSKSLTSLGTVSIDGPEGVPLGNPAIVIENNQIRITPGTAFDALAAGETATISIPYTMQTGTGEALSAVATVTVTGTNDAPYFSVLPEGMESLGTLQQTSFEGVDALELTSEGASQSEIEAFLGLSAGTLQAIEQDTTDGAAIAFDLTLAAGETVSFSWNFASTEYEPFNDYAFVSVASDFAQKLSDIFTIGDGVDDDFLHSSGWQQFVYTADTAAQYRFGIGVMNEGDTAFDSLLYISGFSGIGFRRTTTEDGGLEAFDLLNGALDPDTNDVLTATNIVSTGTDHLGNSVDVAGAVTVNGSEVTIDPGFFSSLSDGESVTVVVNYEVSDGHTTRHNSATLVINGADDNAAPVAANVALEANVLGNGGFEAFPNFQGWTIDDDPEGMDSVEFSTVTLDRNGTIFEGDNAVAVLHFSGTVPQRGGTATGPSITSDVFVGSAGDTITFVYQLSSGSSSGSSDKGFVIGRIIDVNTGAVLQTIENEADLGESTGPVTYEVVLQNSGEFRIQFEIRSEDATRGFVVGARLDLGFAGIIRTGITEDTPFTFSQSDFFANASDPDGDALTLNSVTSSTPGVLVSINPDGSVTYDPTTSATIQALAAGETFEDTFTFTLRDEHGAVSNAATATVTVQGVNDAPEVFWEPTPAAVPAGTPLHIAGMQFDDVDAGADEVFTVTVSVTHGSVDFGDAFEGAEQLGLAPLDMDGSDGTIAFTGTMAAINQVLAANGEQSSAFIYEAAAGYSGPASMTFEVADTHGASDSTALAITVEAPPPNKPPVVTATGPTATLVEDSVVHSTAQIALSDPDGDGVDYDLSGWVPTALAHTQAYDGHFYLYVSTGDGMSWNDAQAVAAQMGGHLANITSQGENDFIFSSVVDHEHVIDGSTVVYIGGARPAEGALWSWYHGNEDGQIFYEGLHEGGVPGGYTNWRDGEPNNNGGDESILVMEGDGTWNDAPGFYGAAVGFIVEFSDVSAYTQWQTGFGLQYGNVVLDTQTGQLTYNLDNTSEAVQNLTGSDHETETVEIRAVDEHGATGSTTVTFAIDGADEVINDRPVLDETASPALAPVVENTGPPEGAAGTPVSDLVDFASTEGGLNNVTDIDLGAVTGIAIYAVNPTFGSLYFTTDNGATWSPVGEVSDASALLLAADSQTRLYFQPNPDFNGTVEDAVIFRAWDQTHGVNGGRLDIGAGGAHTTSVSEGADTVSVHVTPTQEPARDEVVLTVQTDEGFNTTDIMFALLEAEVLDHPDSIFKPENPGGHIYLLFEPNSESGNSDLLIKVSASDLTWTGLVEEQTLRLTGGTLTDIEVYRMDAGNEPLKIATFDGFDMAAKDVQMAIDAYDASEGGDPSAFFSLLASHAYTTVGGGGADLLVGGVLDDVISGGAGDDLIVGLSGNDLLAGGSGRDTFIFVPGSGRDIITDIILGDPQENVDADLIALNGFGYQDVKQLTITESDSGFVRIVLGDDQWIDLDGTAFGTVLNNHNFSFGGGLLA